MDATLSFGQWLKAHRKSLDLTQEELADRIGCSYITIRKIEADERRPSRQIAELLADFVKVPAVEREEFISFARGLHGQAKPGVVPSVSGYRSQGNLPAQITGLVGREALLDTLRDLLTQNAGRNEAGPDVDQQPALGDVNAGGPARLVTLTGPPGIGKTSLALQVARDVQSRLRDGAFFAGMAPINDADLVVPTIAKTLGLEGKRTDLLMGSLQRFLGNREMLLVLDNFEQVLDASDVVLELLESSPQLRVLVTSREPLHISGEQQFQVPPLLTADPTDLPPLQALQEIPAVALFVQRARAVQTNFAITEQNARAVASICTHLQGVPLAIELAAARVNLLSPQEIHERLDRSLSLLESAARHLPPRQRTLRGALDWSYRLLSQEEKILFARLGVFLGGCTLAAAEAVCNATGDIGKGVLAGLASLVDKSLVQREDGGQSESRFSMLEMLREYAAERLAAGGETAKIGRLHAEYHLAFAEAAALHIESSEQAIWLVRLDEMHDNMRTALHWSLGPEGDPQLGLRLAEALAPFWGVHGHFDEARSWLSKLFSQAEGEPPTTLLGKAYARAGRFAFRQSDYAAARDYYTECLTISRALGDMDGVASALRGLGNVATEVGDYLQASHLFEEGLAINRELVDPLKLADCLVGSGWALLHQGNYTLATAHFGEALILCREMDHKEEAAFALSGLGEVAVRQGDYARAVSLLEESLSLRREIDDRWGIAISLGALAWVSLRQANNAQALQLLRESLLMREGLGDKGGIAWCLERLAEIESMQGNSERAVRLYGASHSLRQRLDSGVNPLDRAELERHIAVVRSALGDAGFSRGWEEGCRMNLEEAVDYALDGSL